MRTGSKDMLKRISDQLQPDLFLIIILFTTTRNDSLGFSCRWGQTTVSAGKFRDASRRKVLNGSTEIASNGRSRLFQWQGPERIRKAWEARSIARKTVWEFGEYSRYSSSCGTWANWWGWDYIGEQLVKIFEAVTIVCYNRPVHEKVVWHLDSIQKNHQGYQKIQLYKNAKITESKNFLLLLKYACISRSTFGIL